MKIRTTWKIIILVISLLAFMLVLSGCVSDTADPNEDIVVSDPADVSETGDEELNEGDDPLAQLVGSRSTSLQLVGLLTILSIAPSILLMVTGFTRILIVLSFTRNALGLQQMPPNQVMIALALFLTFFIMAPVFDEIKTEAIDPYIAQEITYEEAIDAAEVPIREFMLMQTYQEDLDMFLEFSGETQVESLDEVPTTTIVPAFITSELKRAFMIGFFIYIPFIVIDMVVASVLMAMGMMMLPPIVISLPFKVLLFVLVDGWTLTMQTMLSSFNAFT